MTPAQTLEFSREVHTRAILKWLEASETAERHEVVRAALLAFDGAEVRQSILRAMMLGMIGTLPHDPGPVLELHVRLLEAAFSMIDWDAVVQELVK